MDQEREYDLEERRQFKVIKSNALIQNSRYQLSAQEQKLILFMLTKIRVEDHELKEITFSIQEFCEVCGIHTHSGGNNEYIKKTIKKLADRSAWMKNDKGEETLIRWIEKPTIYRGRVRINLDSDLAPYLLQLRKNFTTISLYYVLAMSCQYSIRMYELFKSVQYKGNPQKYSLDEFKDILDVKSYDRFADFRRYVFDPAIKEINELTDITVAFDFQKTGRKFTFVVFDINEKEIYPDLLKSVAMVESILDKSPEPRQETESVQLKWTME